MKFNNFFTGLIFTAFAVPLAVYGQSDRETIAGAVLPLPEDLRAEATVFTYDDNGDRVVLRQGSNHVECRPKDERNFTRCFPVDEADRRDFIAKLSAQGLEGDDLQAAIAEAEANGTIKPRVFGSMSYRKYDEGDRIQLLWIVYLPNATSDVLGMPTGSQRDSSLAGQGLPWMMREGTPNAHLMIPINGTEYSNKGL